MEDLQARAGPDSPLAKAVKYAKVLRKIQAEYLGDCKKVGKLRDRINRWILNLVGKFQFL